MFAQNIFLASGLFALSACGDPWIPTGGWQGLNKTPKCEALDLERALANPKLDPNEQLLLIKEYISRCDKDITREASGAYMELLKYSQIQYHYMKNRSAEAIDYLDFEGHRLHLVLFMKKDDLPRPMVIVKCGLQCDPGSTTLSVMLMNLYDEGPFHVLLVPSITGPTYQRDNGIMPLGGYDEGRQVFKLAQWVKSPGFKYAADVSEVHLAGASLGSAAVLYAALYASENRKPDGSVYIRSAFAGCPVVELETSIDGLYSGGIVSKLFAHGFWAQMKAVLDSVPVLGELFRGIDLTRKKWDGREIPEIISRGALDYYKKKTLNDDFNFAPFTNEKITTKADFWKLNRFQNYADQVKIPVFVWAADNDKVVNPFENADFLKQRDPEIFQVLRTPKGNHCMFSDAYSWKTVGAIMRGVLESRSESLVSRAHSYRMPLLLAEQERADHKNKWFAADRDRRFRGLQWRTKPLVATVELLAYGRKHCISENTQTSERCEEGYSSQTFSYESVGLAEHEVPQNEIEAQALTRRLNTNFWVWGAQRGVILPSEMPRQLEVRYYGDPR